MLLQDSKDGSLFQQKSLFFLGIIPIMSIPSIFLSHPSFTSLPINSIIHEVPTFYQYIDEAALLISESSEEDA